jgi:hypothetical protein
MTTNQLTVSLKLDRIYAHGIFFVSAKDLLVPVRARDDIRAAETGELEIHFADHWIPVRPDQLKFCRRH